MTNEFAADLVDRAQPRHILRALLTNWLIVRTTSIGGSLQPKT
jgi:hypothetical protein